MCKGDSSRFDLLSAKLRACDATIVACSKQQAGRSAALDLCAEDLACAYCMVAETSAEACSRLRGPLLSSHNVICLQIPRSNLLRS
ncbi:hypothetical protein HBI56_041210 [Parastagonospora nodorum]|uniref:Uncharacterized protein n=1 Tax=Phaeosphaeria nodorum (strain SN15 / ATCC MYA-4574 / FGSC 10173) TaxID=321614 RepID=A0A7U2EYA0_PHANO|nr:hypothetical protein HBH56_065550 [Parastagonospora nodorum]QRC93275.1 hypothetical protein JI435_035220 [Parastagonospora nodorum SN15]KAH3932591.1 hypothetical protein HBH54_082540 [Parastagonospora nodorum]KAH3955021.1 hypothetical protein HBH53_011850 [Parastagonospora nodorum]KAH3986038.1 hypothetical protein HBH52_043050 [Parastagonospora nodorum]